jgi:HprK-related kinase B
MTQAGSIDEVAKGPLAMGQADERMRLSLGECRIAVKSNDQKVIDELIDYYGRFVIDDGPGDLEVVALEGPELDLGLDLTVKTPDPGKTRIKEEYADFQGGRVVRKRLTGMVFIFGPRLHLAVGPCLANLNQVVNFINNRLIQWELARGCLLAHASGVYAGQRGLALAGTSGAGKSTLALHLMSRGTDFVSNDRLLVRRNAAGPVMTGVPKLPRINPGTALNNPDLVTVMPAEDRARFGSLGPDELWDLEHKYDVPIDSVFGQDRFRLQAPMTGLALLDWRHGAGPASLDEVSLDQRPDLLALFKKSPGLFFLPEGPPPDLSDRTYLDVLAGVRVFSLSGGVDFDLAADYFAEWLQG